MTMRPTDAHDRAARQPSTRSRPRSLNIMRWGYAFIGVGLAIAKWPLHIRDAAFLPLMKE